MKSIATIQFRDTDAQDEAVVLLRAGSGSVALGLSLKTDGDIEVVMPIDKAQALLQSLREAIAIAKQSV
jgi:hypothetical protein